MGTTAWVVGGTMKKISIKELKIRNFKGIESLEIEPDGRSMSIFGTNETGKTTIFDSMTWLLFGKDSLDSAKFEIKPIDDEGNVIHGVETDVSAVFQIEEFVDGNCMDVSTIELRKVYTEKYPRKRGTSEKEFTGHKTNHFVDGVPTNEKTYKSAVANLCDEKLFRLLTDPRYFNTVPKWEDRRARLIDMFGDVTDEDVIASNSELAGLPKIIGKHSLDDYKTIVKKKLPEINREIDDIPVRISEAKRAMVECRSEKTVSAALVGAEEQKGRIEEKLSLIENGGEIAEKKKEVAELESKIITAENAIAKKTQAATKEHDDKVRGLSKERSFIESKIDGLGFKHGRLVADIQTMEDSLPAINEKIEALRDKWFAENSTEFDPGECGSICLLCGQTLPPEKIKSTRQNALEAFNKVKADSLAAINREGGELKKTLEQKESTICDSYNKLVAMDDERSQIKAQLDAINEKINAVPPVVEEPAPPELESHRARIKEINTQIQELKDGKQGDIEKVRDELKEANALVNSLNTELTTVKAAKNAKARIDELGQEEKKLAAEYERLEGHLFLIEKFIRTKVSMLDEKINSKFTMVRWKLFNEQINGGISECCVATYGGVPYESLNNAARINVGLDIINVMSHNEGIYIYVFIDNAESIVDILPTASQQIKLVVSEADDKLRIVKGD
jgi:DNA repair exonuclease SbcCD ATPase subunit